MNADTFCGTVRRAAIMVVLFLATLGDAAQGHGNHGWSYLRNPLKVDARVTSGAIVDSWDNEPHHVFFGDPRSRTLAADIGTGSTAGKAVYFRMRTGDGIEAVRGRVIDGGSDARIPACPGGGSAVGGYRIRIRIDHQLSNGSWIEAGSVTFAHVEGILFKNGATVPIDAKVAVVADEIDTRPIPDEQKCTTAPHLHIEATTKSLHKTGYYDAVFADPEDITHQERLFCIGGGETSFYECDM